ncbi:MAG TPA: hypothetical protein VFN13_10875 [Rudaea sp.]|nr:hypothetical protein [Rudaea sp.]
MSGLFQRLAEDLPERYVATKTSFACDGKSLREWLTHLPLANPGATARLLIGALREMNQLRVDPQQRVDALELLRPPIDQIVVTLSRQVLGDRFPLPAQKLKLGALAQDFELEMALGYRSVVYDLCAPAGAIPFLRGKVVALALTRAIQHYGACLYQVYLRYHTPPAGIWQSLHDLFRFAVAVQLDDKAISDPLHPGVALSARLAYIQALLFALSNPYRCTQKENGDIFLLTRIWASHCDIREGRAPAGAIAIRTDSDRSLGYLPEEREAPGDGLLALEISGLMRNLEGQLAMLPTGMGSIQFRPPGATEVGARTELIKQLMSTWDSSSERNQARLAAGHMLDSVVGLHDLHFVLAGNMSFEAFLRKTRGLAISMHDGDQVASWASAAGDSTVQVKRLQAKVLDQSLGGYRLLLEQIDSVRLRVGELVGLAPPADDDDEQQDWMVGCIRWLRIDPAGPMDVGIELLARRCMPVAVRPMDKQGIPRTVMRGVSLDTMHDAETSATPVMVPHTFDMATPEIELTRPGDPFAWPSDPRVDTMQVVDVRETGGGYLRLLVDSQANRHDNTPASPHAAANDDSQAAAAQAENPDSDADQSVHDAISR